MAGRQDAEGREVDLERFEPRGGKTSRGSEAASGRLELVPRCWTSLRCTVPG